MRRLGFTRRPAVPVRAQAVKRRSERQITLGRRPAEVEWNFEPMAPNILVRRGWRGDTVCANPHGERDAIRLSQRQPDRRSERHYRRNRSPQVCFSRSGPKAHGVFANAARVYAKIGGVATARIALAGDPGAAASRRS